MKTSKGSLSTTSSKNNRKYENPDQIDGEEQIEYVNDGKFRRVKPYFYTYLTYCKERWRNRTLIDIFTNEFRDREESYYRSAIVEGKVRLNDKIAAIDTIVKNGDLIIHKIHRHEPPVSSKEIKILKQFNDLIIIDKPSGIPVHPAGRYRFNSVTKILQKEHGMVVHPCNRLDRLTSGLMFLAKNSKSAEYFKNQLVTLNISKEYIARCKGNFPNEEITVEKPLITIDPKLTLNVIKEDGGRYAKTIFKKLSFDPESNTSIVLCKPLTGRTHQIRVHLQYLGFPIANDPIYSNLKVWGDNLGKNCEYDLESVRESLDKIGKTESSSSWFYPESKGETLLADCKCEVCGINLYSDPGPNDLGLWLHAYKYSTIDESESKDDNWSYETDLPEWALEPHLKFMKLAVEEAQKCEETTTAFSVGAVLVKDGEILETGYSRELPGNTHAEQCALEKYFAKNGVTDVPTGTVIYTTMEPCSERLSGNLPCVDRILKTCIKTVFVGVLEPDTFIKKNVGLEKLSEKNVSYVRVPGFEKECLAAAFKGHPTT